MTYGRWVITLLLTWPLLTGLIVLFVPARLAKQVAFAASLIEFVISVPLWWAFVPSGGMQFMLDLSWIPAWGIHYTVGLEGTLDCWIDPADRAWSNGIIEPGNRWTVIAEDCGVDPALNPNHVTVTCETEDLGDASQAVSFERSTYTRDAQSTRPSSG